MKIGILTLPLNTNYGGILQAYALQTFLQNMGHEVCILDKSPYYKELTVFEKVIKYPYRLLSNIIRGRNIFTLNYEKLHNRRLKDDRYTRANTDRFINNYLNIRSFRSIGELEYGDLAIIIVGSDQIWRKDYLKNALGSVEQGFLKFLKNNRTIKRISYAASFGTDKWEYNEKETREISKLLKLFDAVSVREQSGVINCRCYLNRNDAKLMIDPTLLLSRDDYVSLVNKAETTRPNGSLLCYILDMDSGKQNFIDRFSKDNNLRPFYTNSKVEDSSANKCERVQVSVEQWLRGFIDADYVITDSFHACVFSILFHKPFLVLKNSYRGVTRIESLLQMFGLEDRMVSEPTQTIPLLDFTHFENILKQKRLEAKNFIMNSICTH